MKVLRKNLEIRKAYFLEAFGQNAEEIAIVSFAGCNFSCPYCKRDCQYVDPNGDIIHAKEIRMTDLLEQIDKEARKGRRIRLSGGDPCVFIRESLAIAEHVKSTYGEKLSIAHNGSSASFVTKMLPYLSYIALDYKAFSFPKMQKITGIPFPKMRQKEILTLCEAAGVFVDVRTPIFGDTDMDELRGIANVLKDYKNVFWTLRKYNKVRWCEFTEPAMDDVTAIAKRIKSEFPNLKIGTRNYWKGGFEIL